MKSHKKTKPLDWCIAALPLVLVVVWLFWRTMPNIIGTIINTAILIAVGVCLYLDSKPDYPRLRGVSLAFVIVEAIGLVASLVSNSLLKGATETSQYAMYTLPIGIVGIVLLVIEIMLAVRLYSAGKSWLGSLIVCIPVITFLFVILAFPTVFGNSTFLTAVRSLLLAAAGGLLYLHRHDLRYKGSASENTTA